MYNNGKFTQMTQNFETAATSNDESWRTLNASGKGEDDSGNGEDDDDDGYDDSKSKSGQG
jgi:hypothetical protein